MRVNRAARKERRLKMAIEINLNKAATTVDMSVAQDGAPATQGTKDTPILSGESLKVTNGATTDLEKLVAQLKNESETTRQNVAQRRVALLQTVLDSMADKVTEAEKKKLLELETLNGQKAELDKELSGLNGDKAATEGRITALDIEIAKLEKQVELAVEEGADHRERVAELKAQRAREQERLDRIDGAIKSVASKIADVDVKISECTNAIASTTLSEVSAALRAAAGEEKLEPEKSESDADRKKAEAKEAASDIGRIISESLDKIDEQIMKKIDEARELVKA